MTAPLQISSAVTLNIIFLIFLLVPGYLMLRGYQRARVRLDTLPRLDKILTTVTGGVFTLAIMLILYRFGALGWLVNSWYSILETGALAQPDFNYDPSNSIGLSDLRSQSIIALLGFMAVQSIIGFLFGWAIGRVAFYNPRTHRQSKTDLEQPWEHAVRKSAIGDPITVITRQGREIKGVLYRIGSPSKKYDLLLAISSEVIREDEEVVDTRPLGVTYHHFDDISQIQFTEVTPEPPRPAIGIFVRLILRSVRGLLIIPNKVRYLYFRLYYRLFLQDITVKAIKMAKNLITTLRSQ